MDKIDKTSSIMWCVSKLAEGDITSMKEEEKKSGQLTPCNLQLITSFPN